MRAYFVSTPLQALLAITLTCQDETDSPADLYVLDHFRSADELASSIRNANLFTRVEVVESKTFAAKFHAGRARRKASMVLHGMDYKRTTERLLDLGDRVYSDVYFSFPDVVIQLALRVLHKRNAHIRVHLFEDGLGSYGDAMLRVGRMRKAFNAATGHAFLNQPYDEFLVFRPEMISGSRPAPVRQMRSLSALDHGTKILVNDVFSFGPDQINAGSDVVFFEQPLDYYPGLDEALFTAARRILPSEALVKRHPRSDTRLYDEFLRIPGDSYPWEVVALNMNIQDATLVSLFSTASASGKIMFDAEPRILFLYDLPELGPLFNLSASLRTFVERLQDSYSDRSRICVARSIDEARAFIEIR